jgi:uracil-DNA glycosylase family 4
VDRSLAYWLEEARAMGITDAPSLSVSPSQAAPQVPVISRGSGVEGLLAVEAWMGDCKRCGLCNSRTRLIYGQGDPRAELMFIGLGPTAADDSAGYLYSDAAGELLTKMIEKGMKRPRSSVFLAGVVKCKTQAEHPVKANELTSCMPFLKAQIEAVAPKCLVLLGAPVLTALVPGINDLAGQRGRWVEVAGVPAMPTFDPGFLLRKPEAKREAWMDLKKVMERLS